MGANHGNFATASQPGRGLYKTSFLIYYFDTLLGIDDATVRVNDGIAGASAPAHPFTFYIRILLIDIKLA